MLISILLTLLDKTQKLWAHKRYRQVPKSLEKKVIISAVTHPFLLSEGLNMAMILPTTTNQGLLLPKYLPLYQMLTSILLTLLHKIQKL